MLCTLEIEYKRKNFSPRHYIDVVQEWIPYIIPNLKKYFSKIASGPIFLQYLDDENDLISIDFEEEFEELVKLAKKRSSEGKCLKIIVNGDLIPDQEKNCKLPCYSDLEKIAAMRFHLDPEMITNFQQNPNGATVTEQPSCFTQWKVNLKSELKQEILSEIKSQLQANGQSNVLNIASLEYEEDFDDNLLYLPEKKKGKLIHSLKKLEKKEKQAEHKMDHHFEKLERKRKKLLERASLMKAANKTQVDVSKVELPFIMSGIATRDSLYLSKRVHVGKVFLHQWKIINDGTMPWNDVQLQHTWSSPGLEPDELSVKCNPLLPGHECQVTMKFRAPKTLGTFITYWYFVYGPKCKQFGHYVSLTGSTVVPKHSSVTAVVLTKVQNKDCNANDSHSARNEEAHLKTQIDVGGEAAINNKNEKCLASSEIAAEMAREAANALLRCTSGKQAECSVEDELSNKCLEVLNLVDSGSDSDVNVDLNEETDPGFVVVNYPSMKKNPTDKNIQTLTVNSTSEEKENNKTQNQEGIENKLDLQNESGENDNVNASKVMKKETGVPSGETLYDVKSPSKLPSVENLLYQREGVFTHNPITPNFTGCGFPTPVTVPGFPLQHAMPQQQAPTGFAIFPQPGSTSHAICFPPPAPPMSYFTAPKVNPPMPYPQVPNYSPMMTSTMPSQPLMFPPPLTSSHLITLPKETPTLNLSQSSFLPINPPLNNNNCNTITGQKSTNTSCQSVNHPATSNNDIPAVTKENSDKKILTNADLYRLMAIRQSKNSVTINNGPPAATNQATTKTPESQSSSEKASSGVTVASQPTDCQAEKDLDTTVQILPQALVDGAINVAATACSTAWNALNTLRPKEGETQVFDPVFENNMALLMEMGFRNVERNARLLKRFNNDVSQVIGVICASPGGGNLEID